MEAKSSSQTKLPESEEKQEKVIKLLEKRLEKHVEDRKAVQGKLAEILNKLMTQVDELEDRASKRLEERFTSEDNKLQAAINELCENSTASALQKAKAELLVEQLYELTENKEVKLDLTTLYELKAERRIVPELIKMRKPTNVRASGMNRGRSVSVEFTCLNSDEERVLSGKDIVNPVKYKCLLFKKWNEQENKEYPLDKDDDSYSSFTFAPDILDAETTYRIRVKVIIGDRENEWSDEITEFTIPKFKECCVWKKCPDNVDDNRKYSVDDKDPRIAAKLNYSNGWCTIIGDTYIPLSKVIQWSIKIIHKLYNNNGRDIYIGIAPSDINQNKGNYSKCGWYFNCYCSTLYSGPPHSYSGEEYRPRKEKGQYVHTGDSVGVVVDTTKGDLSFVLNGVNRGVAYKGIPLDKPLVPCVILFYQGDSVELI